MHFPFSIFPQASWKITTFRSKRSGAARQRPLARASSRCPLAERKLEILERALLDRVVAPLDSTHPAVTFAVRNFRHCPQRPISAVTEQIGLSDRRFIQLFFSQVGMTPKRFCRVQRFQQVLRKITGSSATAAAAIDWPEIALTCGYFDQSHFIHDFRAFSGINPSTYVANKTQFQNHVAL